MASSSSTREYIVLPGPENKELLTEQHKHVSEHVWNEEPDRELIIRRAQVLHSDSSDIPQQVAAYLERAGFLRVAQLGYSQSDPGLISALVERWRPETHTFHMPPGECTITLQDVGILLGLKVDGLPVVAGTSNNWNAACEELLGVSFPPNAFHGSCLKMRYLNDYFQNINDHNGSSVQFERYIRAYILRIIGGLLFVDHSSSRVPLRYLNLVRDLDNCGHYSWGSAVLAYLYAQLCKATNYEVQEIGGCIPLIQLWAWERFPQIAPERTPFHIPGSPLFTKWFTSTITRQHKPNIKFYRRFFDCLKRKDIVWQPYSSEVMNNLPVICIDGVDIWRAVVPLICFNVVEWHQSDRVMRQFGLRQAIPGPPCQNKDLHGITLRGKTDDNWEVLIQPCIELWNDRRSSIVSGSPQQGLLSANSQYMRWYTLRTRRWISRTGAHEGHMMDTVERTHYLASTHLQGPYSKEIRGGMENIMLMHQQEGRLTEPYDPAATINVDLSTQQVNVNIPARRRERGLTRNWRELNAQNYNLSSFPPRVPGQYFVPPPVYGFQSHGLTPPALFYYGDPSGSHTLTPREQSHYEDPSSSGCHGLPPREQSQYGDLSATGWHRFTPPVQSHYGDPSGSREHGITESHCCPTLPVQSADGDPFHIQPNRTEEIDVSLLLDQDPYQFGFMDFFRSSNTTPSHPGIPQFMDCLTPSPMSPPLFTPDAPRPWQNQDEQPRHSVTEMGMHGLDLNVDLMAEVTPDVPPPTGQNEEQRRNPPRASRNQRRWCGT